MPIVSIIMPSYNSAAFITKSIESVINQTFRDWELIICDDCSNDDSLEIANHFSYMDSRIKILENKYKI